MKKKWYDCRCCEERRPIAHERGLQEEFGKDFFWEKGLAFRENFMYTISCCDMIAMKFEVTTHRGREFGGANVKLGN